MPSSELTEAERKVLQEALEIYVKDLGFEISNTEKHEYRASLKHNRELLQNIIKKLS